MYLVLFERNTNFGRRRTTFDFMKKKQHGNITDVKSAAIEKQTTRLCSRWYSMPPAPS